MNGVVCSSPSRWIRASQVLVLAISATGLATAPAPGVTQPITAALGAAPQGWNDSRVLLQGF